MFTTGVTVPTLHVGMLYTASCWSTDIHHLPYVQYLHGEADIVWWDIQDIHVVSKAVSYLSDDMNMINVDTNACCRYSVPSQEEAKFKSVMKELIPTLVSNSPRWLKEDTAMVSGKLRVAIKIPIYIL